MLTNRDRNMLSFLKILGKILLVIFLITLLVTLFGYIGDYLKSIKQATVGDSVNIGGQSRTTPSVTIGNTLVPVEVVKDEQALQKGLSGRTSLDQNSGMFFIFPRASIYRFWMPDMHFPIDLFWINNGQVVGIEQDMSPYFDPSNPRYYSPSVPAQYVLEVNAGFARRNNIRVGDPVIFNTIR